MKVKVLVCHSDGTQELVEREISFPAPPPLPEEAAAE